MTPITPLKSLRHTGQYLIAETPKHLFRVRRNVRALHYSGGSWWGGLRFGWSPLFVANSAKQPQGKHGKTSGGNP